jgi:GDP-L-fucose synthase
MPTNLYGPGDSYNLENSHVLPALIRKFHEAKVSNNSEVILWGTGNPQREFLHVDDLADACVFLLGLNNPPDWINVGWGEDIVIKELASRVADTIGYTGNIVWDTSKPDGASRKLLDISRLTVLGWKAKITLREGLRLTYQSYLDEMKSGQLR